MAPLVFVSDPDDIRAVITAPLTILHSGVGAALTKPLFGETAFILREEEERMRGREAILPPLCQGAVETQHEMIADLTLRTMSSWPLETPIAIHPRLCVLTLTVMLRIVFGDSDPILVDALRDKMLAMLSVTASLVLQEPRLHYLPGWHGTWSRFTRQRDEVDELIAQLIACRRETHPVNGDMLDMLLATNRLDGSPLSATELRDNLVAVIVAGHETTASTLAWAFQLLAHNPTAQDTLIAELDAGEGEDYLQATVNEVLRHRPVFLFATPRAVAEPIEIGGWTYNPPAHLLACMYLMHHDPNLFIDPQEFRPERFLDTRAITRTWLPWGGGRQICPGRHLALQELRTVLAATLSQLRILPARPALERPKWRSAIVTPHAGCLVILRKRPPRGQFPNTVSSPNQGISGPIFSGLNAFCVP
jgi:cytochrome P450